MLASVAGRAAIHAVSVRVIPAPTSLADSRELLRILQTYGEITTYRWLKHDNMSSAKNAALAIFSDRDAMNTFVRECPLMIEIDRTKQDDALLDEPPEEDVDFSKTGAAHGETSSFEPIRQNATLAEAMSEDVRTYSKYGKRPQQFSISAQTWEGSHKLWLERHPFWGRFTVNAKSIVQNDLKKRVPLVGLSDLDSNDHSAIPMRYVRQRRDDMAQRPSLEAMVQDMRNEVGNKS